MTTILYARVSNDGPGGPGLGLEAQVARCAAYAAATGCGPTRAVADAVSGATEPDERPGLGLALAELDAGRATMLVAVSLSRIGRRACDVLAVANRAERHGWNLALLDLHLDTRSATGWFALTVLAAVARLERELSDERIRDALGARSARGARLGRPVDGRPDPPAAIGRIRVDGHALAAIVNERNASGRLTLVGRPWQRRDRDARPGVGHPPADPCRGAGTGARGAGAAEALDDDFLSDPGEDDVAVPGGRGSP